MISMTPKAQRLMRELLVEIGIRPLCSGCLEFNFDPGGRLSGVDEHRHRKVHYVANDTESVAKQNPTVDTQAST